MSKILGIDTSNYTTSAAVFDTQNMQVYQSKTLLPVKSGECGIRQSDAVFHHVKQIPIVLAKVLYDETDIDGIGVSIKPRMIEGSYMPCFLVGESIADSIGSSHGIVPDKTSHQIGHILAALYSCSSLELLEKSSQFIAFHVSGGTTDMLLCTPSTENILDIEDIGHSLDLKAGQVIDRVGVMLGLDFPCGKELDLLANKSNKIYKIRPVIKGLNCCLSGIQNQCQKLFEQGENHADIAKFCIMSVNAAIIEMTKAALNKYGDLPLVYAGGVMSNSFISENASNQFGGKFAMPEFSCDNAVGVAIYSALRKGLI